MTTPTEQFRAALLIGGSTVSITEVNRRDGGRHDFHVTLHDQDVRLTEGQPFDHWPLPQEITALVDAYTPDPSKEVAALIAALRNVCRELRCVELESSTHREWARNLRESLEAELPDM